LIITIAAAVIILVALVAFLVYPQFEKWTALNAEVAAATQQADAAKLQLQERQGFKDRAVETSAKWLRLENQVPENPDLPSLIIELQDNAFKYGVQVALVTPATPTPDDAASGVTKIPIQVEVFGSWDDTVDFLESLMRLDRGVRITDIAASRTSDESVSTRRNVPLHPYAVDTNITLEAYVIPSAAAPASNQ
jgi:type IV pilus assembly protein PilO